MSNSATHATRALARAAVLAALAACASAQTYVVQDKNGNVNISGALKVI